MEALPVWIFTRFSCLFISFMSRISALQPICQIPPFSCHQGSKVYWLVKLERVGWCNSKSVCLETPEKKCNAQKGRSIGKSNTRGEETCTLRLEPHPLEPQATLISQAENGAGEVLLFWLIPFSVLCIFDEMEEKSKDIELRSSYGACLYVEIKTLRVKCNTV